MAPEFFDADGVRGLLRDRIDGVASGSREDWAVARGISPSAVYHFFNGRRAPSKRIVAELGLERIVLYRRTPVGHSRRAVRLR